MSNMHSVIRRSRSPFDLFLTDPFDPFFGLSTKPSEPKALDFAMKTDIVETENSYELTCELPGFAKENIQVELKDGYLGISAQTTKTEEEGKEGDRYLRKERFVGTCSRRFYVGEDIKIEDISAGFENGILSISVPKKQEQPKQETGYTISIN